MWDSASFHKGGKTLVDLDVSSGLPTFSVGSRPGPNANSLVERRVGMLHRSFRTLLLRATGGNTYFEQLWGAD